MRVLFFEDFSQDTPSSIAQRYPGSTLTGVTGGVSLTPASGFLNVTAYGSAPRREIYVEGTFPAGAYCTMYVHGIYLAIGSAGQITAGLFSTPTTTSAYTTGVMGTVANLTSIYIDANIKDSTITCIVNNSILLTTHQQLSTPTYYITTPPYARSLYAVTSAPTVVIKRIVVVEGNTPDQMLDISSLSISPRALAYSSNQNMSYTTTGYAQDVSKTDPTLATPAISTQTTGSTTYTTTAPSNWLGTKVYSAGYSENANQAITVNDQTVGLLSVQPTPMSPVISTTTTTKVSVVNTPAFTVVVNVTTTASTNFFSITAPASITIDWGDTVVTSYTSSGTIAHSYPTTGNFTIQITGSCAALSWGTPIIKILDWGYLQCPQFSAFVTPSIQSVPNWLPTWVTVMISTVASTAVFGATFNDPNIVSWNTSRLLNVSGLFYNCPAFNQNIGVWDMSSLNVSPTYMFQGASAFSQDLSGWNVHNIPSAPTGFASGSGLTGAQLPVWGSFGRDA